jgi:hypothetical protein
MSKSFQRVVSKAVRGVEPPLTVLGSLEGNAFDDALVELQDGITRWRIIRERSILSLVAAPERDCLNWYDLDLLKRLFRLTTRTRRKIHGVTEPSTATVEDLVAELQQIRSKVAAAFAPSRWNATRRRLRDIRRQRNRRRLGIPLSHDE